MIHISHFWKAIKLSWLRRLKYSKSTWARIHRAETKPNTFNPMTSSWMTREMARSGSSNLVWKEIYGALLSCRKNVTKANPIEFLTLPVSGEPYTARNNLAIQQDWCESLKIRDVLTGTGNSRRWKSIPRTEDPCTLSCQS